MKKDIEYREIDIKRFGYVISAVFLIISNIALINNWPSIPIWFLLTMYFLTASLWIPTLLKPFYLLVGKYFFKNDHGSNTKTDMFSKN